MIGKRINIPRALAGGAMAAILGQSIYAGEALASPDEHAKTRQGEVSQSEPLAKVLALPVAGSSHYFNRATNTALRESCKAVSDNAVTCRLDVLGLTAQIAHTVYTGYERDASGAITVKSRKSDVMGWSQNLSAQYRSFRDMASKYEWSSGSSMVVVGDNQGRNLVQNNVYQVSVSGQDGVSVCSSVPVNDCRGIDVCLSFDKGRYEVLSVALPRVGPAGSLPATLTNPAAAVREFDQYDDEHFGIYRSQIGAGSHSAYVMRRD